MRIQACGFKIQFGEELQGGKIVGGGFGHDGAKLQFAGLGDELEKESGGEALAAVVEIDTQVENAERFGLRVGDGGDGGDGLAVVLGDEGEAFLNASDDLLDPEGEIVAERVAMGAFFAQRANLRFEGDGEAFAGFVNVQIFGGFAGGVDVSQRGEIGGDGGADLHDGSIASPALGRQ